MFLLLLLLLLLLLFCFVLKEFCLIVIYLMFQVIGEPEEEYVCV